VDGSLPGVIRIKFDNIPDLEVFCDSVEEAVALIKNLDANPIRLPQASAASPAGKPAKSLA
jgi:hypothetical protein